MKAVAYRTPGSIDREDSLVDITLDQPVASGRDLLVRVKAVSVNPVDTKLRKAAATTGEEWKVLGYDASGVIEAVGDDVKNFKAGDAVFYAGSISRPGTNSEFHLVDERIVGRKPASLSDAEAAALPLTSITAWEMLFDRLEVLRPTPEGGGLILVVGGAGGVGSIAIQLLRALTDLTVIATASRPETQEWVKKCGAHHVIDHSNPLAPQIEELGLGGVGFVFSTTQTHQHLEDIAELMAPQGRFGLIDDPEFPRYHAAEAQKYFSALGADVYPLPFQYAGYGGAGEIAQRGGVACGVRENHYHAHGCCGGHQCGESTQGACDD